MPSADDYREIARRTKASGRALYLPDYMAEKFQRQLARIAEGAPDKLGVLRPWAWGPESVEQLTPLLASVTGEVRPAGMNAAK